MRIKYALCVCILFLICFVAVISSYSSDFCSLEYKEVVDTSDKETAINGRELFYIDDSGRLESVTVVNSSGIVIAPELIKGVYFKATEFKDNHYVKNVNIPIVLVFDTSLRREINDFINNNFNKRIAILSCNKLIAASEVRSLGFLESEKETESDSWLFDYYRKSFDPIAVFITNIGIAPQYKDLYVKDGKPTYKSVTKKYKMKTPFNDIKEVYPINLDESEYWVTNKEADIYVYGNNEPVKLPKGFIVEQIFSLTSFEWEHGKEFIKVVNPYGEGYSWVTKSDLVPFFSTLNTDLFLGTFFINNEYEWNIINEKKEHYANDYTYAKWKRIESVRNLYIKEAKARFVDEKEFRKWYQDMFDKPFVKN